MLLLFCLRVYSVTSQDRLNDAALTTSSIGKLCLIHAIVHCGSAGASAHHAHPRTLTSTPTILGQQGENTVIWTLTPKTST